MEMNGATFLLLAAIGALFLFLGWRIWRREQISLINNRYHARVSPEYKKPYTEKMGKALLLIGLGLIAAAVVDFSTDTGAGWLVFAVFLAAGLGMILYAQIKYNHGIL